MLRKNRLALIVGSGLLAGALLALVGCGLFASQTSALNPTGLPDPNIGEQMVLSVRVPQHATVQADCAHGDANSCAQAVDIGNLCKESQNVPESFRACAASGWISPAS